MPDNIPVVVPAQVLKYLAGNHPFLPSNAVIPIGNNSYKIRLAEGLIINSPGESEINGVKYYKVGQHLYFNSTGEWSTTGRRDEQQTAGSKTGITLTGNIEKLPNAPA